MAKATCRWPECDKGGRITRGFCATHYMRALKLRDYDSPWKSWRDARRKPVEACRWPECDRTNYGRGLCHKHYQRARNLADFETPWESWGDSECEICGTEFAGRNRLLRYCSTPCNLIGWKRENPERVRELGRRHSARRRAQILATQVEDFTEDDVRTTWGDTCYLCGDRLNFSRKWPHPKSPSLDHVVPLSKGGTHTLDNVAFVCLVCNHSKNNRLAEQLPTPTLFGAT